MYLLFNTRFDSDSLAICFNQHEIEGQFLAHSQGSICSASLGNHTCQLLATGGDDKKVHIWTIGKATCILSLTAHKSSVEALNFNGQDNKLASGSKTGSMKIWDLQNIKEVRELSGHKASVLHLDFLPVGDYVGSSSQDASVKLWDVRRRGCIRTFIGHNGPVNTIKFSPDGKWVVSGGDDGCVKLWDIGQGKELHSFASHSGPVTWAQFHRSLLMLTTASVDGSYQVFDLEKFEIVGSSPRKANGPISWTVFHPEDSILYSASANDLQISAYEPASQILESVSIEEWKGVTQLDAAFSVEDNQVISIGHQPNTGVLFTFALKTNLCAPFVQQDRPLTQSGGRRSFQEPKNNVNHLPNDAGDEPSNEVATDPKQQEIHDLDEYLRVFRPQKQPSDVHRAAAAMDRKIKSPGGAPGPNEAVIADFLPPKQDVSQPQTSDTDTLKLLRQPHDSFVLAVGSRHKNLQSMRALWARNGVRHAMESACQLGDPAVTVDLLNILVENQKLWSLDLAATVLPHLTTLMQSKYTAHVETSCHTVRLILKNFTEVIKMNVISPPGDGGGRAVDLNREDRYRKCLVCFNHLKAAGAALERTSSSSHVQIAGAREVLMMIKLLE